MTYVLNVQDIKSIFSGKCAIIKSLDKNGNVLLKPLKDNSTKSIYTNSAVFNLANYLSEKGCKSTFVVESVSSGFVNRGTLVEVLFKAILDFESGKPFLSQYKKAPKGTSDFIVDEKTAEKLGIKLNKGGEIEIKYSNTCNASACLSTGHKLDYLLMITQNGVFNVKVKESDYTKHISYMRTFDDGSNKIETLSKALGF